MPHTVLYLLLLCYCSGSDAVWWSMSVPVQVNGIKGQNVVLPCSFTHPDQQLFAGEILVKWINGKFAGDTFFQCSVVNSTEWRSGRCSDPNAPSRYSLQGNLRARNLSLLIQGLKLSDMNQYYCRVELDRIKRTMFQTKRGTFLSISALPEILSLSLVVGPPANNVSLECVAEGNPLPSLTCLSPVGLVVPGHVLPEPNPFQVIVRFPVTSSDNYVCQATNQHGTVKRVFSSHQGPSAQTLALWISVVMILLGLGLALLWLRWRGSVTSCSFEHRCRCKCKAHSQPTADPVSEIPLYANSCEIRGDTGIVYADINVNNITNNQVQRSMMKVQDQDVCYAEVTFR